MTTLSNRLGFWSATAGTALFLLFTVCFIAIAANPPLFIWTNLADYLEYTRSHNQLFKYLAQSAMLLFGPVFLVLLHAIHEDAPAEKKLLSRIATSFGLGFAVLTGIHYFLQLSIVRQSELSGTLDGIGQFLQANPHAAILAIDMLGWTLFLGLATLFAVPLFPGKGLQKTIRYALLINACCCLLGGVGFVLELVPLVFLTINLGMGGAMTVAMAGLMVYYFRKKKI